MGVRTGSAFRDGHVAPPTANDSASAVAGDARLALCGRLAFCGACAATHATLAAARGLLWRAGRRGQQRTGWRGANAAYRYPTRDGGAAGVDGEHTFISSCLRVPALRRGGGGDESPRGAALLPPRHERAHAWRRAVVALLDGRELRTFQAEALAHVLLDRDVFALAAVKLTLG